VIVEYIRYRVTEDVADDLVTAYEAAAGPLLESSHCLSYEVSRCAEEPTVFVVRIEWDSARGHLEGFRGSPQFRQFFELVKPFFQQIEEMRHYEVLTSHVRP
jgi:quinol monooxygenase YgiN